MLRFTWVLTKFGTCATSSSESDETKIVSSRESVKGEWFKKCSISVSMIGVFMIFG